MVTLPFKTVLTSMLLTLVQSESRDVIEPFQAGVLSVNELLSGVKGR